MGTHVDGYVTDIGYTFGYYPGLNPLRARLALLRAGLAPPRVSTACELGYGQGISANIHAAAQAVEWHGCDVMPAHAAHAQGLAAASGARAHWTAEAFAEFCHRPDLPDFDFIGLHGVWSWVSDDNRALLADFFRRKLAPGGVIYVSYNALPGWSSLAPLQHLLIQHTERIAPGDRRAALDFALALQAQNPLYSRAGLLPDLLKRLSTVDERYFAHEYFNANWRPMNFSDVAADLMPAGLAFAASANYRDHLAALTLGPAKRAFQEAIADPVMRETVGDYLHNRNFREDYWIKSGPALSPETRDAALRAERLVLTRPAQTVSLSFDGFLGAMTLPQPLYGPIIEAMADHRPHSLGEVAAHAGLARFDLDAVLQAVMVLAERDEIASVQDDDDQAAARPATARLNTDLAARSAANPDIAVLASTVTGGGVAMDSPAPLHEALGAG